MSSRRVARILTFAVLAALLLAIRPTLPDADARGGWGDKWEGLKQRGRETVERARESVREHAPRVRERTRQVREKAGESYRRARETVRERAPQVRERVSGATQRARETWQRTKPRAQEAWRHVRSDVLPEIRSLGGRARKNVERALGRMDRQRLGELSAQLGATFAEHGPRVKEHLIHLYEGGRERLVPRVRAVMEQVGPRLEAVLHDSELRDRAVDGLVTALDVYDRYENLKDTAIRRGVDTLGKLRIEYRGETLTMNEWSGRAIVDMCPYLEGTTLAREPVQALTYTLVCREPAYILQELRVLKNGHGEAVSVAEAFELTIGTDSTEIVAALDVAQGAMELRSSLRSGEGVLTAALEFSSSIRSYSTVSERAARAHGAPSDWR